MPSCPNARAASSASRSAAARPGVPSRAMLARPSLSTTTSGALPPRRGSPAPAAPRRQWPWPSACRLRRAVPPARAGRGPARAWVAATPPCPCPGMQSGSRDHGARSSRPAATPPRPWLRRADTRADEPDASTTKCTVVPVFSTKRRMRKSSRRTATRSRPSSPATAVPVRERTRCHGAAARRVSSRCSRAPPRGDPRARRAGVPAAGSAAPRRHAPTTNPC